MATMSESYMAAPNYDKCITGRGKLTQFVFLLYFLQASLGFMFVSWGAFLGINILITSHNNNIMQIFNITTVLQPLNMLYFNLFICNLNKFKFQCYF